MTPTVKAIGTGQNGSFFAKSTVLGVCLYYQQRAAVRVGDELTELVEIKRRVRQGCVLSPDLFTLYTEVTVRVNEMMDGFSIGELNISNV